MYENRKKISSIFLLTLIIFFGIGSTLMAPVQQDIILTFGNSKEVKMASDTIMELNPRAVVVSIENPLLEFTLRRSIGVLFIIGHGSDEGISTNDKLYSWNEITNVAQKNSLSAVYFISCNSYKASLSIKNKPTLAFGGDIEPVLGAMLSILSLRYSLGQDYSVLTKVVIDRMLKISEKPEDYDYLGTFSKSEKFMNAIFITLAIFGLVFSAFSLYANKIKQGSSASKLIRVAEGVDGINSVIQALVTLVTTGQFTFGIVSSFTLGAIPLLMKLIGTLSFWNQAAAIASLGVDLFSYFSPASIWNVLGLILASAILGLTLAIAICDYRDPDGTFGNC